MSPRDITRRVLSRPLRSPYLPGGGARPRSRWIWLVPIVWLLWVVVLSDHSLLRIARLRQDLHRATAELQRVHRESQDLQDRLDDPQQRAEHAEEALRRLGMVRPGETIYRIGGAADTARAPGATPRR